jgi:hypothetical protein
MDASEFFDGISKLGLGGIVFVIWYFDNKKIDALQDIVKEQVEEKKLMREERQQFIAMIEKSAALLERASLVMSKLEKKIV